MKTRLAFLLAVLPLAAFASSTLETYDQATIGQPPAGWTVGVTGEGTAHWTVVAAPDAPSGDKVLQQDGIVPKPSFPLCLKNDVAIKDGFVEVKFKSVSGKQDQAAGLVWRCQDRNNYYICRANALESNVVLYKVVAGQRTTLEIVGRSGGYGVKEPVALAQWHTLRIDFVGDLAVVRLNGKELFQVKDTTFTAAGTVGLWTKGDSVTLFDNLNHGTAP